MTTFILILTMCIPSDWSGCGNGIQTQLVTNLPSKEACEQAGAEAMKHAYNSYLCVPQATTKAEKAK